MVLFLTSENVRTLPQRASKTAKAMGKITLAGAEFEVVQHSPGEESVCGTCHNPGLKPGAC